MKTNVLLIKADKEPVKGIKNPLPNQIYKNPYLETKEISLNELDANNIRIKMLYVGVCGSDMHLMKKNLESGYICTSVPVSIPKEGRIIGHEGVGEILEVGENVHHLEPGMIVTLESIKVCNQCESCKSGNFNQCRNSKLIGLELDGIMGEIVDVDANLAHDITEYVKSDDDLKAMACIEPAGVSFVACENADVKAGDNVLIFGAGPIGAYCALLSKLAFGAAQIHVVEPIEYRRKLVKNWATSVYSNLDELKSNIYKVDVVIETSGDLENVNSIFNSIQTNGRVVLLARSGKPLLINAVDYMITNNIKIVGSRGHLCGAFNRLLHLYKMKKLPLKEVITRVVSGLDELKEVLESNDLEKTDCKALVKISDMYKGSET